jgi:hypothetical protein
VETRLFFAIECRLWLPGTCTEVAHALLLSSLQSIRLTMGATRMTPEPTHTNEDVVRRVQGEFLEMPGLRLTEPQARRLWGLDSASCTELLRALVDAKFLFQTRDGAFMRHEQAAPVKASLKSRSTIAAA